MVAIRRWIEGWTGRRKPDPERLLDAVRALGVARLVAGGEVPLKDGGWVFIVNSSVSGDDLRCDPWEAVGRFRDRAARILARLRERGASYDRYVCQFVIAGRDGTKVYGLAFNRRFEPDGEVSYIAALDEAAPEPAGSRASAEPPRPD